MPPALGPQTIDCGWQALLMHAARVIDEQGLKRD
jgi:hypothetical protein